MPKVELIVQIPVAKAILTKMDRHDDYYLTKRDLRDAYRIVGLSPVFTKSDQKLEYRVTFETKQVDGKPETLKTLMEYVFKTLVDFSAKEEGVET